MDKLLCKAVWPASTTSGKDDTKVKGEEASEEEEEEEEVERCKHQLSQATMGKKM
jgi:hypothetical protein